MLNHFSHVQVFAILWTVSNQAPLSMGSLGKNTGVGCLFLFQGIFLAQGLNTHLLRLLHCRQFFSAEPSWKPMYVWYVCMCVCVSMSMVK